MGKNRRTGEKWDGKCASESTHAGEVWWNQ